MFDVCRRWDYTRRLFEARSRFDRRHCLWPTQDARFIAWREYYKFLPDRKEHPAYFIRRIVHPRFRHVEYYRGKFLHLNEAWINKIERNSPRALRPSPFS